MRQGKLLDENLGSLAVQTFGPLSGHALTKRMEMPMVRLMREALREAVSDALLDARNDGSLPYNTGRGYREAQLGVRAFGTRFADLRAHILAPGYMVAHERGTLIEPQEAPQLAIPLPAALRPDGTPRLPRPSSWRLHGSFIYKSKRTGRGYIARKDASGQLQLLYVFVDEAQLSRGEGAVADAWARQLPRLIDKWGMIFRSAIEAVDTTKFVEHGEKNAPPAKVKAGGIVRAARIVGRRRR